MTEGQGVFPRLVRLHLEAADPLPGIASLGYSRAPLPIDNNRSKQKRRPQYRGRLRLNLSAPTPQSGMTVTDLVSMEVPRVAVTLTVVRF